MYHLSLEIFSSCRSFEGHGIKIDDGGQWMSNLISLTHLYFQSVSNLNRSHTWLQVIAKLPKLKELSLVHCSLSDHFILSSRPSIFNFSTSLSVLDLSFNTFTSPMVFQWVSNTTSSLVELDLSNNILEGSTSIHFGMFMNSLRHLDLSTNYFKARDLKSFMNICTLSSLNLYQNNLTEDLPSILDHLSSVFSSLKTLSLDINRLSGTIPEDVKLPSTLEGLSIILNFLDGGIPKLFGNACALRSLDMSHNSLNLSIFSTLQVLKLSENELNGKIPEGNKLPYKLEDLSIRSNRLEGGIAKLFGNACSLLSLDMFNNSFTNELPKVISHLSCARYSLEELNLGVNQINGILPDFSTFTFLKRLNLSKTKLNGEIPKDIQLPPQLEELYMDSNSLIGVLSDYHFANMSNLKKLHLSDNLLALTFIGNWVPPFQLPTIELRSCKLGPTFPKWLQSQNKFFNIDISNVAISDIVPEWFWAKLPRQKVMKMNISYNNLRGILPKFPPTYIPTSMSFGSNQFEGSIPLFLRNFGRLDLSKNKLSSSLSFSCENGTLQGLSHLDLSYNRLSEHIPDCWRQLNSLVYLDLSYNKFSRKIPTSMGSLLHLQALLLRNNSLVEGIPFSMRNCRKLVMVDMSGYKLSGSIPDCIGTERELQILILGRNQFFGSLPSRICCLRNIQLLDLLVNNLSGKIPKCIKNLTSMAQTTSSIYHGDHWYFFKNSIYATNMSYDLNALLTWKGSEQMFMNREIPLEIKKLSGLISLNLSRKNLTGEIPSNIGNLAVLDSLDLSRNQLVDLSHNHLTGKIPTATQLQGFNPSSYEDNFNLCGPPLKKMCAKGRSTQ
ncbi:hypothetical protein PHAVU_004G105600 [Phaseolus vulgaris]|uniref:Leucine-rich repeat-containing N-terminal plant-type domain-containing protein n=1 Tax=Phaseolus vulgaris TaxID=3885 RepID=V7C439_PHAVU|nr:hypothetical protein PHAVU_004G105600g [Phaseolus vulgaris]ESW24133.1 hypothetical protein PHAVU_004G105600g [Phaseolus vulgaris]